jgi:hypothetical protein
VEKEYRRTEGVEGKKWIKKNMQNKLPLNLNGSFTSWIVRGSIRGRGQRVFCNTSRPGVDPTQHRIQWVTWILSLRVISV